MNTITCLIYIFFLFWVLVQCIMQTLLLFSKRKPYQFWTQDAITRMIIRFISRCLFHITCLDGLLNNLGFKGHFASNLFILATIETSTLWRGLFKEQLHYGCPSCLFASRTTRDPHEQLELTARSSRYFGDFGNSDCECDYELVLHAGARRPPPWAFAGAHPFGFLRRRRRLLVFRLIGRRREQLDERRWRDRGGRSGATSAASTRDPRVVWVPARGACQRIHAEHELERSRNRRRHVGCHLDDEQRRVGCSRHESQSRRQCARGAAGALLAAAARASHRPPDRWEGGHFSRVFTMIWIHADLLSSSRALISLLCSLSQKFNLGKFCMDVLYELSALILKLLCNVSAIAFIIPWRLLLSAIAQNKCIFNLNLQSV